MREGIAERAKVLRVKTGGRRILATSDIHGNLELFRKLLERCGYRPGEDVLVIVGDLLEKGPDSLGTLRYAMELAKEGTVYALCGNCDYASQDRPEDAWGHLSRWREKATHWQMGLEAGIRLPTGEGDVLAFREKLEELFPEEYAFLRGMPQVLETERFLFAHTGLKDENLECQDLSFTLSTPWFPRETDHVFSKLLLVGHYPTSCLRRNCMDNTPLYHETQNVLSIDGGNMVKTLGQLNGVILNSETGTWDWAAVNGFPRISAPCSQTFQPGETLIWPEDRVEVLERGKEFSLCRAAHSGKTLEIPNEFLFEREDGTHCDDITGERLDVAQGEAVDLVKEYSDRLLIMKGGRAGFLFLR